MVEAKKSRFISWKFLWCKQCKSKNENIIQVRPGKRFKKCFQQMKLTKLWLKIKSQICNGVSQGSSSKEKYKKVSDLSKKEKEAEQRTASTKRNLNFKP